MTSSARNEMNKAFEAAQAAILAKDKSTAGQRIEDLEALSSIHLRKNAFDKLRDFFGALIFALVIAVVVRQMWFEYYEIPTGSMRPTLKEKDRLVVSKNQFGVNVPLLPKHFYFNPSLVKRGGIVVFSGRDMDIPDVNTMYFYLFPGKKQYIKRLIGKPGDTLYFASGNIYGIDKDGNDISSDIQRETLGKINHIPYIHFEGRAISPKSPVQGIFSPVVIYQMNEPVAKLYVSSNRQVQGEMLPIATDGDSKITKYEDLWGFKNYAMARIIDRKQYLSFNGANLENITPSDLYLELTHSPSLQNATLERDYYGRVRPSVGLSKSYIPLNETHLKRLFDNLYTARFLVDENGSIRRYGYKKSQQPKMFQAKIDNVPAGTYEFYHGKAHKIGWQGALTELPKNHPIYAFTKEKAKMFFNLGIEFDTRFSPDSSTQSLLPSRYAFFRDQNLYVMDTLTFNKDEKALQNFRKNEELRSSYSNGTYSAFTEQKVTNSDGTLNVDFIKQYGITVPDKSYLCLGDNYAMSADTRDFGFVPEENLKGVPDFLFWPFGERFGYPNQPLYGFITLPRLIVWVLAFGTILVSIIIHRKRTKLPQKFD
ncbi:MAG: hypothetical protein S4CHLAM37_04260 [Chlamydiia bacterium]|nr:hypothetical protein [Chlamydiia bacterium]